MKPVAPKNLTPLKSCKPKSSYLGLILFFLLLLGSGYVGFANNKIPGPPPAFPEKIDVFTDSGLQPVAYLPAIFTPPEPPPWINTQDRGEVQQFYLTEYLASDGVNAGWTGNHGNCDAGTTTVAFRDAILRRINYFRMMAGIPEVTGFNDSYNSKAQAAALMMSVNRALNHTPPSSWACYSDDGYTGASSSNLYLGVYGPAAISGYIYDPGDGNYFVGHRRWILYPQTQYMGTGDIPPQNGYSSANALWVFDNENIWGPRPSTREAFVAWPPPGFVPYQVVYPRWSFAYANADLSNATVSVTQNGQSVSVSVSPVANGFGENTLVWEMSESIPQPPSSDIVFNITIGNVIIDSGTQQFNYQVTVFNPNS